jgi:hypothetical protein
MAEGWLHSEQHAVTGELSHGSRALALSDQLGHSEFFALLRGVHAPGAYVCSLTELSESPEGV